MSAAPAPARDSALGRPVAEIFAEVLEVPEGTVNSRMAEALSQLSRLLEPALGEKGETKTSRQRGQELLIV